MPAGAPVHFLRRRPRHDARVSEYSWPAEPPAAAAAWHETIRALPVGTPVTGEVVRHTDHHHQVGIALRAWLDHEDPLPELAERVGVTLTGQVTKIAPIGFFVRVAPCVDGLVPHTGPPADLAQRVRVGQELGVGSSPWAWSAAASSWQTWTAPETCPVKLFG